MEHKITLIGSTGLIGSHFLEGISKDDCQRVNAITRRSISNLGNKDFIKQLVHNFSDLGKMRQDMKTDVLVSALGSTTKKAGSKDEFMKIDHDLPLEISRIAKEEGCKTMILISSKGANSKSKIFYIRVKGLLEESLEKIVNELINKHKTNFKGIGQPLRIALTGSKYGPGLYNIILSIDKNEIVTRLQMIK